MIMPMMIITIGILRTAASTTYRFASKPVTGSTLTTLVGVATGCDVTGVGVPTRGNSSLTNVGVAPATCPPVVGVA